MTPATILISMRGPLAFLSSPPFCSSARDRAKVNRGSKRREKARTDRVVREHVKRQSLLRPKPLDLGREKVQIGSVGTSIVKEGRQAPQERLDKRDDVHSLLQPKEALPVARVDLGDLLGLHTELLPILG